MFFFFSFNIAFQIRYAYGIRGTKKKEKITHVNDRSVLNYLWLHNFFNYNTNFAFVIILCK